jgi:hypothetical protein
MRPLDGIEAVLCKIVETPFAQRAQRRTRLDLRSLVRQLAEHTSLGIPTVALNPADYEALGQLAPQLEAELGRVLVETGHGAPKVHFVVDPCVASGSFQVKFLRPDATQLQPSVPYRRHEVAGYALKVLGRPPVPIMHTPFKIGRALDNDLVLGDTTVSRYHAVLELEKDVLFVRDLRSTNGTYLNGRRIERSRIKEGDVLRLGQAEISVVHD